MPDNSSLATSTDVQERADYLPQIGQAICCRLGHRVHDLQIWLEAHGLILSGCTSSYYGKQLAQHVARELSGIGIAENRIVVDSHPVASSSHFERFNKDRSCSPYTCHCHDGLVTTQEQRDQTQYTR
jgi:hypothetical protein